jgi:formate dehydrogenase iron-sulfur subunit
MYACPFGIPTFEWRNQLALIKKCDNCGLGGSGSVSGLRASVPSHCAPVWQARRIVDYSKGADQRPESKLRKEIYGEDEVGGTSMMYLSALPFERYGLRTMPEVSPAEVNREVMHMTPFIGGGMALALSIIYFIFRPRGNAQAREDESR